MNNNNRYYGFTVRPVQSTYRSLSSGREKEHDGSASFFFFNG